jgi:hypothetical protein
MALSMTQAIAQETPPDASMDTGGSHPKSCERAAFWRCSTSYKNNNFAVKVHSFHFPSCLNPCTALIMSCFRISFVGPPSSVPLCGPRKLDADFVLVFHILKRHLNSVAQLPFEPIRQGSVFIHAEKLSARKWAHRLSLRTKSTSESLL